VLTGNAIAAVGFRTTYGAVGASMTLSTFLLMWCVRRAAAVPGAAPAVSPS